MPTWQPSLLFYHNFIFQISYIKISFSYLDCFYMAKKVLTIPGFKFSYLSSRLREPILIFYFIYKWNNKRDGFMLFWGALVQIEYKMSQLEFEFILGIPFVNRLLVPPLFNPMQQKQGFLLPVVHLSFSIAQSKIFSYWLLANQLN